MSFRTRAANIANLQAQRAVKLLDRTADKWLWPPWETLGSITGGLPEGSVWFVGGFSGDGKTTFLTSAVDAWHGEGKRIYYVGTESAPTVLLTHWACKRLGLDAGDVLAGRAVTWHDWPEKRSELVATIRGLQEGDTAAQVHFAPVDFVTELDLVRSMKNAHEFGADLFILDHIDHIQGDGDAYSVSRSVCQAMLQQAHALGLRCLVATQFNNESIKGNRLGRYQPPQPTAVYMGGHKRQIADGMLGLYRPLKRGVELETLREFQRGSLEPKDICEPNTMGVVCMKHRLYGSHEGRRIHLRVEKGRVIEPPIHQDTDWNV